MAPFRDRMTQPVRKGCRVSQLPSLVARFLVGTALALSGSAGLAQMVPSSNLSGNPGLIDMPSGEPRADGLFTIQTSRMGPIFRYATAFQFTPRLSGTFRYVGINDWNDYTTDRSGTNKWSTYYDRNFDIAWQILTEGRYRPSLTIGMIDFAGTGINSAEYLAATKTFAGRVKLTAGLGFGRLGSSNPLGAPFGARPVIDVGKGGKPNYSQWFRGDAALFGGVEYAIDDKWTAKVEYSSDAYAEESTKRGTFDRASPWNFGVEYRPNSTYQMGAYYMYGDQVAINLAITMNPGQRPSGGLRGPAPYPVLVRPSPQTNPEAWVTGWTEGEGINAQFITPLQNYLDRDLGLTVESLEVTGDRVQVRYRSGVYDAPAQAMGRVARALTYVMPASIEVFELVPVENGMAATKVVIYRSNLEKFEAELGAADALYVRSHVQEAGDPPEGLTLNPALYPAFSWGVVPVGQTRTFDPADPFQLNLGAALTLRYEPAPGVILSGNFQQMFLREITNPPNPEPSLLPNVRSSAAGYQVGSGPVVENLTAAWYGRLGPDLYGRVTAGYLERMFGGVSTEVLYRPEGKAWALGVEANYVAQRNTSGLGFNQADYRVATGHVSGYLDMGEGYQVQLDVGRYLAGDTGATFTLAREFANGWRLGGFATLTNVSAEQFGEGSFDKGVFFQIPINWFLGQPTRAQKTQVLRPIQRDGGARLGVEGRLNGLLREYDDARLTADWARVWK